MAQESDIVAEKVDLSETTSSGTLSIGPELFEKLTSHQKSIIFVIVFSIMPIRQRSLSLSKVTDTSTKENADIMSSFVISDLTLATNLMGRGGAA